MLKRTALAVFIPIILVLAGANSPSQTLFINADVLTMDAARSRASAVLIVGRRIVAVGTSDDILSRSKPGASIVDLGGKTLLPGIIDAHSHFPASHLATAGLDLAAPPVGTVDTIATLLARISAAATIRGKDAWLLGFNYDDALLKEARHPTRIELDATAPDNPVYLSHSSGHMGVANSRALSAFGIDWQSPNANAPEYLDGLRPGGQKNHAVSELIGLDEAGQASGLLQERAAPKTSTLLKHIPRRRLLDVLFAAHDAYLESGVTTVQNGHATTAMSWLLYSAQLLGLIPQRVIVWPAHLTAARFWSNGTPGILASPPNNDSFSTGAVKIIVDGSPQGQTAWLSAPYMATPIEKFGDTGVANLDLTELKDTVLHYHRAGQQLALHGNGDAAIDIILDAVAYAQTHSPRTDTRHLLVHGQTLRRDQLPRLKQLDMGVSFFVAHSYFWGDWYRQRVLGEARAASISPLAWADEFGVNYSLHTDAPVTPMRPMQMIWSASERMTLSGVVLGPELRIDRYRALEAITIDAAWQNRLDASRGSIEVGKLADLIVLSENPLTALDVRQIRVEQTWIDGKLQYSRH
ncbi:MAG: amidohydrolase [Granulosicoccus sp.]